MAEKVGVYICGGCGIGQAIDVEKLAQTVVGAGGAGAGQARFKPLKVEVLRTHSCLCGAEGAGIVRRDIAEADLEAVVVAACSPRAKTEVFTYDASRVIAERVNLREHVAWCQAPGTEDTFLMAEDYLRMGIARAQKVERVAARPEEVSKTILVVGGGITGLTAAREVALAGYGVVLVEKAAQLGGYVAGLHRALPRKPPYLESGSPALEDLIGEVESSPKIRVFKSARIQSASGGPGMFEVVIQAGGATDTVRVGAIVEAPGFRRYDATRLDSLGYGRMRNVVTHEEVEAMARSGGIVRPSDGRPARNVVFIQCAGSRDPDHLPYCSAVCCLTSLKQAQYVRAADRGARVFIIYKDMRTPGQYESYYQNVQQDEGVFLTKGEVTLVQEDADRGLRVGVTNTLLGQDLEIKADLVVLATGMVPMTADILNLTYRQGPELPALKYGFPDSHYVCFPYESRRTGIYPAGCVRQPMLSAFAVDDAAGAALKAIQCVEMVSRGEAVHPRSGDRGYPELFLQRCTQCKRCTEECPFGMYDEDEKGTPKPNPTRCRRCGICMGSCPERIIGFPDFSVDSVGAMVKAIGVPEEDEEKPRAVCFICENDAYPCVDLAGIRRLRLSPFIRFIPLRCLGDMNIVWIADALSKGIDGILLIGCKHGDDYQCHFMEGSELAGYRMGKIQETLDRLVLEADRIRVHELGIDEYGRLPGLIEEFMDRLAEVGPNPYK